MCKQFELIRFHVSRSLYFARISRALFFHGFSPSYCLWLLWFFSISEQRRFRSNARDQIVFLETVFFILAFQKQRFTDCVVCLCLLVWVGGITTGAQNYVFVLQKSSKFDGEINFRNFRQLFVTIYRPRFVSVWPELSNVHEEK